MFFKHGFLIFELFPGHRCSLDAPEVCVSSKIDDDRKALESNETENKITELDSTKQFYIEKVTFVLFSIHFIPNTRYNLISANRRTESVISIETKTGQRPVSQESWVFCYREFIVWIQAKSGTDLLVFYYGILESRNIMVTLWKENVMWFCCLNIYLSVTIL